MPEGKALVLGGGGVAGIAWMTGLLTGLAEAGAALTGADLIIGTSAGANVAAQVGSGLPLADLYARQADPERQSREIAVDLDLERLGAEFVTVMGEAESAQEIQRRMGAYALAADTVPEATRRAVIESRLPSHEWPERAISWSRWRRAPARRRCSTGSRTVSLVDAVAASSAVPGIWPPVTIGARRYVDGGVRSADNADLAVGWSEIVIVSPLGYDSPLPLLPLREVVATLRDSGSAVTVLTPDAASAAAIGANPLDPGTRTPAAQAGLAQGRAGLPGS